jgi:porin
VVDGGLATGTRWLDNINMTATLDLDRIAGWQGGTFFVNVLNNLGGRPNDLVGSIQGVNNIEVANTRLKVYEAWIEQAFGNVTLRAGLYDLNSEFYQNDASGLLISPPFGIGSELSATGPNGPSIFPSTALAARLAAKFGKGYAQAR